MSARREWAVVYPQGGTDVRITIDPFTGRPFDKAGVDRLIRTEQKAAEAAEDYRAIPYRVVYRDVTEWLEPEAEELEE